MAASLGEDGTFDFVKVRRKAAMPKLAPPLFSHGHVYFVMISGPINVLGKTVEIHGT
jgi:hypothetical protein